MSEEEKRAEVVACDHGVTTEGRWTPERHAAAKERCERATPGPWTEQYEYDGKYTVFMALHAHGNPWEREKENVTFAAHARTDLPDALAEIERLQAEIKRLREALDMAIEAYQGERG